MGEYGGIQDSSWQLSPKVLDFWGHFGIKKKKVNYMQEKCTPKYLILKSC